MLLKKKYIDSNISKLFLLHHEQIKGKEDS